MTELDAEIKGGGEPVPRLSPNVTPYMIVGEGTLGRASYIGSDFNRLAEQLLEEFTKHPRDMGMLLDLSIVLQMAFRRDDGLYAQREALARQQIYRVCGSGGPPPEPCIHLLALMAPGDLMTNTPLEFMVEGLPVRLDLLFIRPDHSLPEEIPEHDVLFVAVSQSEAQVPLLKRISKLVLDWPRPVLQEPERILQTSRDGVYRALAGAHALTVPAIARIERERLAEIASGAIDLAQVNAALRFPVLLRPLDSHAGHGLAKIDDAAGIEAYLAENNAPEFYLSAFIEYAGTDGQYRKYRIALIEGRPFLCHMAISDNWMIHYVNAGMAKSETKRAEEAAAMASFDNDFGQRHAEAFRTIHERLGLDYLVIDCGESPDGDLLLFEADTAMVIHTMDPPELFPYKKGQMEKVFAAFYAMVEGAARSGASA